MLDFAWDTQCRATVYYTVVCLLFHRHIYMLIDRLLLTLGIKCIKIFLILFQLITFDLFAACTCS